MDKIKKIMIAVDLSERCVPARQFAAELAKNQRDLIPCPSISI